MPKTRNPRSTSILMTAALIASAIAAPATNLMTVYAAPPTYMLHLRVQSARAWVPSGLANAQSIPHYRWLVVQDDTGDPTHYPGSDVACKPQSLGGDPAYPANCQWPGIHSVKGGTSAEVVAQGDETTLNETTGIDTNIWLPKENDHNPNHSYMISIMADGFDIPSCTVSATVSCHVDGFKISGQWFSLPLAGSGSDPGLVTVNAQPYPLPLATVRMQVWNDLQTNGAYDTGEPNLAGFEGHIADVLDAVTTDWYGNPLCTTYQHDADGLLLFGTDGKPVILQVGGHCLSDANGVIKIPYLGPNRYASTVTPPNGQVWYQTSTLEGWHDWDTWTIEGWDGYDPEFVQGAEPFPFAEFGFVQVQTGASATACCNYASPASAGSIKGTVVGIGEYSPQVGGLTLAGGQGKYIVENIKQPLVSLIDTGRNDNTVYVGRGNPDGTFQITNIPDGDYVLSFWDEDQAYLLTQSQVSIVNGQALDMGVLDVAAWHSQVYGKVCFDTNRNGKCDTGEPGLPNLALNLLDRDNKVAFFGDNTANTDSNGNYRFPRTYPLGQWVVTQGYWEQFYTVGVTYQTENQPTETTVIANGGFVDVSSFNQIGHLTRMDFAVHTYESAANAALGPTNGGIVGEVIAATTRNELDARFQSVESYEPGLPDATVHLYAPVKCVPAQTPPAGTACTPTTTAFGSANYLTISDTLSARNGAYVKLADGPDKVSGTPIELFEPYTSETWQRPSDCVARGADGSPVIEQVLPVGAGHDCLEAPLMSSQVGDNGVGPFMQVNGNYGFTLIDHDPNTGAALAAPIALPPADYLVEVESPKDVNGRPAYEVVKEEDINVFSGDSFVAPGETPLNPPLPNRTPPVPIVPAIPPFPCAGPLHTVNVTNTLTDANYNVFQPALTQGVYNPDMVDGGGSPYEGMKMPLCDTRLVTVRNGRSATPNFHFKTATGYKTDGTPLPAGAAVPLPGRIFGIVVDDLNLSVNSKELFYGEKYGIPNMPIGIYDFANHLVKTIQTDPHGFFEVILPSTSSYNCPLPAGPCPGMYRFLGNDPGQPGHLNPGYNPAYRTIGAVFEVWPGVSLPADLAPTPVAFGIENPGTQQTHPAACLINDPSQPAAPKIPELFSVNVPYVNGSGAITINGQNFGATQGGGRVTLDGASVPITTWGDNQIVINVTGVPVGPHQLKVTAANTYGTVNGLTIHVRGGSYNPTVIEVGPGKTYDPGDANPFNAAHAVQRALDAAASSPQALVVVYPGIASTFNAFGSYFENVVIHSPVKLQGVGPGGLRADNTYVPGSILDGLGFGTDSERDTAWQNTVAALPTIIGPGGTPLNPTLTAVPEGAVILAVATSATQFTSAYPAAIDGLTIQNGDVLDFVPNVNSLGNGTQVGGGNNTPVNPNQGGGIVAFASTKYLRITNNIIRSNGGAYAGAIRLGTPNLGSSNNNDGIAIANNRILNNGGTNLAGAIGIFAGTNGYEINNNDLCGNFSSEYGGGISHFGLSPNSKIHDNRIYFNGSYDEGGGIIIAGEPPLNATSFGAGAGAVDIYNNIIEANMANDDGGGLRFLTAGNFPYNVYNNFIVNNISSHEGGGVAIDNAPNVRFFNNTVMKNLTTATAATSNGQPAPAGLSTAPNNAFLQATLPAGSPNYSNPLLFNNIFWDNRAGTWNGANIVGIGGLVWSSGAQIPDPTPINYWDMGVPGTTSQLAPTNSVLQSETTNHNDVIASPTNKVDQDPLITAVFDTSVQGLPWRGNPNFVGNTIVAQDVPISIMGDYHLSGITSSAYNAGAASKAAPAYQQPPASVGAPALDIDLQSRPSLGGFDSGADELPGAQADLAITKSDGLTTVNAGSVVPYVIVVTNNGPAVATTAPVIDNFPASIAGVAWTCVASAGSTCGVPNGTGNINTSVTLLSGGSATFAANATLAVNASGTLVNTASVTAPPGVTDPNLGNNSATDTDAIRSQADLSITKTNNQTTVNAGGIVTYTIRVSNAGPGPVTGATVTDIFPAALTLNGWTCTTSGGATCGGAALGSGNINRTVNIPVGGVVTFNTLSGVSGTASGALNNTATVAVPATAFDPNPANNSATDTDTILAQANLGITKNDNVSVVAAGGVVRYTLVINNAGPSSVVNAPVTDNFPATVSGITWTCTASFGASCGAASGSGNINTTASLPGLFGLANVTYVATGVLASSATGTLVNTASVAAPAGTTDPTPANNSATDTDTIVVVLALPALGLLDNFNRANANTLGASWSQTVNGAGNADLRINGNQVLANATGMAIWNVPTTGFGARQGAAFTFANGTVNNAALILKASGGTAASPTNYIRVRYQTANGGQVVVETTTNGTAFTTQATFNTSFANGDTLSATALNDGSVNVYKTSGSTTPVGSVVIATSAAAVGRIGLQVPNGGRVDNFSGGNVP